MAPAAPQDVIGVVSSILGIVHFTMEQSRIGALPAVGSQAQIAIGLNRHRNAHIIDNVDAIVNHVCTEGPVRLAMSGVETSFS